MGETWAENLVDGHRVLPALLADVASARRSVHLSIFLFFNDPVGQELERALAERALAGVAVRVLINLGKTSMGDPFSTGEREMMSRVPSFPDDALDVNALAGRLRDAGAEVVDTDVDLDRRPETKDAALLDQWRLIHETSRMDAAHVDHRKLVVIDGWIAYVGSANVGAQYLYHHPFDLAIEAHEEAERVRAAGGAEPWWKWHDGLVRFEGAIAAEVDAVFRERWVLDGGHEYAPLAALPREDTPRGVRLEAAALVANRPDRTPNPVRAAFLREIAGAERSIFITNPYVYHPRIVRALVHARRRNPALRVELVVPGMAWNDNAQSQDAMQHHYARLLRAGISVHEYQNHFTHLKLACFDERLCIVGSANLNFRSMENDSDFELVVRVESEAFARRLLEEVRDVDLPRSRHVRRSELTWRERRRDPRTLLLVWRRLL